ncbi:MAG: Calx-beta domain-containing protein [Pyrinomonadaceae bacterium]
MSRQRRFRLHSKHLVLFFLSLACVVVLTVTASMAVLPMRLNVDAPGDPVILRKGHSAPSTTMFPPLTMSAVTFSSATFSAGEAADVTLITVTRSGDSSGAASVQFSTAADWVATGGASCTAGVDYVSTSGTLNWAAGDATSKTFPITICDDTVFEGNEPVNLTLSNATGATLGAPSTATLTITDNDPQPTISITDVTQAEGNSGTNNFGFTVSLSAVSAQMVTVQYATANGTATAGSDYQTNTTATLTFNPGITSLPVNALVNGDTLDEDNETCFVNLSGATNATITDNQGLGTINDDDPLPNLTISDVSQVEGDGGPTNFNFAVSLSAASGRTVTVNYATADATGIAVSDYQGIGVTTLTFTPGQTSKTVTVLVNADTANELDETFQVNLSSAANANITDGQGQGTILNDDDLPTLSINDVSVTEGNSGTANAAFTVSLSPASGQTVTVTYATANGTATARGDYQAISLTTLTFNPGITSLPVNVMVNGDTLNEDNEAFVVNLSSATNANITDGQGQGTITNDDALPTLSINDVSVTEGNNGTVTAAFTVSLSPASGQTVTVNYATANGTATAGGDYQAINTTALTFNPGETNKTVTVVVIGDTLNEADETVFVNLTNTTNATVADNQGIVTITNDDPMPTGNLKISGRVVDDSAHSISGLLVILSGAASGSTITDSNGNYSFANLSAGNYTVAPSSGNYSFSPPNHSFDNLRVDRIANFVGTQTLVGITGRVTDSNDIGLGNVSVGLSMDGIPMGIVLTDFLGNYGFGTLPAGANYAVTPVGGFSPSILFFNSLSTNATADFKAMPSIPPTSAAISGRAADANNNPLANITVTLSGPITRVTSTDSAGNYSFANLAPGGNYAVTIQNTYFVFSASRADFLNLSGSQTFNFMVAPVVVPSPSPPPSDDFNGSRRDPNKWNLGIQTQPATAFDPLVNVAQINGELVITPLSQVSDPHFNGYVSANSFDLRGGAVSVELVQAATGGADTTFAVGSDLDNFYRFMVHTAGPATNVALTDKGRDGIERSLDTTVPELLFQVNVGGQLTALSIPYDPVQHRFMRFRHDAPANAIVFETSPDSIGFTERHRVVLMRSVSALTAELSAGTSNPINPGATVFDNFGLVTSTFQFSSASYMVEEGGGSILITVTRAGSTTAIATVDYATADGTALQTTKYISAAGRLTFVPGQEDKTFRVLIIDNAQAEGNQNLNLLLQEPAASGLNTPGRALLTIVDNDTTVPTTNRLEDPTFFVTQHYYDFLNRESDAPGLAFWVDQITGCGSDTQCIEIKRINVSAAYFLSIEYQDTGFLVHRFYNLALNRANGLPRYLEFFRDTQAIGNGVIVGALGWEALLEANRVSYANEFATRAEFTALYPLTLSAEQYVDALYGHAEITPSVAERQAAIVEFSTPAGARGRVLRRVAENQTLRTREFNRAFVLAQYFGYLRRNPDAAPDNNLDGYNFWLGKLNQFNGNFVNAEMVKAFITAGEYRQRFGP